MSLPSKNCSGVMLIICTDLGFYLLQFACCCTICWLLFLFLQVRSLHLGGSCNTNVLDRRAKNHNKIKSGKGFCTIDHFFLNFYPNKGFDGYLIYFSTTGEKQNKVCPSLPFEIKDQTQNLVVYPTMILGKMRQRQQNSLWSKEMLFYLPGKERKYFSSQWPVIILFVSRLAIPSLVVINTTLLTESVPSTCTSLL